MTQVISHEQIDVFISGLKLCKPNEQKSMKRKVLFCDKSISNKNVLLKCIDIIQKKNIKKTVKQRKIEILKIHKIDIKMWSRVIRRDREYWYARWMVNGKKFQSKCIDLYTLITKFRNLSKLIRMRRSLIKTEYDMIEFIEWSNKILKQFK